MEEQGIRCGCCFRREVSTVQLVEQGDYRKPSLVKEVPETYYVAESVPACDGNALEFESFLPPFEDCLSVKNSANSAHPPSVGLTLHEQNPPADERLAMSLSQEA